MTLDTKDVFFQLVGFDDSSGTPLINAMDSLEEFIRPKICGTLVRYVVKQGNNEIEF
jgi:hypothetical protein